MLRQGGNLVMASTDAVLAFVVRLDFDREGWSFALCSGSAHLELVIAQAGSSGIEDAGTEPGGASIPPRLTERCRGVGSE